MRLGEAEVGETLELVEDALARGRVNASRLHPRHEIPLEGLHALRATLSPHGSAQLIGAGAGQARRVRCDAHELLLKEGNAQGLTQGGLQQGVQVGDRFPPSAPAQIRVDRAPLDGSRPHESHLDDDVVEAPGLQARKRVHLRARLHLKHAHRVSRAQQVVDARVLRGKRVQAEPTLPHPIQVARRPAAQGRMMIAASRAVTQLVEGDAQSRQHAEREQIELHQARVRAVLLVPLEHGASLHRRPPDRTDTRDRLIGQDHAARMDAHVSRQA